VRSRESAGRLTRERDTMIRLTGWEQISGYKMLEMHASPALALLERRARRSCNIKNRKSKSAQYALAATGKINAVKVNVCGCLRFGGHLGE
jgi:hypothetical protein